jgi:hypothetical protein
MSTYEIRREELRRRCQHERNDFIATAAFTAARLPQARAVVRWMRFIRRVLRAIHPGEEHASH